MTKEEKIKEAYGRHYDNAKKHIRNDGSIDETIWKHLEIDLEYRDLSTGYFQPIDLRGIENNLGWIKIESESDLPEHGYYEVIQRKNGINSRATLDKDFGTKSQAKNYSHYQKIKELPNPIY